MNPRRDREVYPHVEERIGEDPARFLDREAAGSNELVQARIRGIDSLEVLAAWTAVEEQLLRTPERGRLSVKHLLQERARELESLGDREARLERRREVLVDESDQDEVDDEPTVWRHEPCGSTDVVQESRMAWFCQTCEQRTNRVEAVEAREVAA